MRLKVDGIGECAMSRKKRAKGFTLIAFDLDKGGGLRLRPIHVEDWNKAEGEKEQKA